MVPPLVSVVLAVKDGEAYIREALRSVVAQRHRPLEIIVVDGQSRDRSVAIARSFDGVRVVEQDGRGIAEAYNIGVAEATGEFVSFLSCDDVWSDDKLDAQVGYMLAHPDVEYTVGRAEFFLEPGVDLPPGFRPELLEGAHTALIVETLVARRTAWTRVGTFDTALTIAHDVDWFARARHLGVPTAVLPYVLLRKRIHGGNASLRASVNNPELLKVAKRAIRRRQES
jgi:glycosyltransferase involved in cell wall biosynthesis